MRAGVVVMCACARASRHLRVGHAFAQPPFTVQLKDQYNNVVEQQINATAGEFRFESARVIYQEQDVDPVSAYPRRNWTIVKVQDSNG